MLGVPVALPGGAGNDRIAAAFKLVRASVEVGATSGSAGHQATDATRVQSCTSAVLAGIEMIVPGFEGMFAPLISKMHKEIIQALHAKEKANTAVEERIADLEDQLMSARDEIAAHDQAIAAACEATATAQNDAWVTGEQMKAEYHKCCVKIAQRAYNDGLNCLALYGEGGMSVRRKYPTSVARKKPYGFPVSLAKGGAVLRPDPPAA
jgi:hypothetical protein